MIRKLRLKFFFYHKTLFYAAYADLSLTMQAVCKASKNADWKQLGKMLQEGFVNLPEVPLFELSDADLQMVEMKLSQYLEPKLVKHSMNIVRALQNGPEHKFTPDELESVINRSSLFLSISINYLL